LGDSLEKRINQFRTFSLKLVLQIGIKIISLLKVIHDKGLIHRDIKPDNFLLGLKNEKKIYIIDFGFCKCYNRDRRHIEEKEVNNLIGSQMYASINAHNFIELSRRDDLESLGYMLAYFYLGNLPWQNIEENEKIKKLKENIINNENLPDILVNYIKYVRLLNFNETPNYYLIIEKFKNEIMSIVQNNNKK
jgi:serine/threonine protein kinase